MLALSRMAVVAVALAVLSDGTAGTASSGDKSAASAGFVPDGRETSGALLENDVWLLEESGSWAVRLRRLDEDGRRAYLSARTGTATDPFASSTERSQFLSFLLEIENHGDGHVVFHPQNCLLRTAKSEFRYPIDFLSIESAYRLGGQETPPAYLAALETLFDGELILSPGGRTEGLLVYPAVDRRTKSLRIEIRFTTSAGQSVGFSAPYRRMGKRRGKAR